MRLERRGMTARVERILADGEWHPLTELYAAVHTLIRPEVAMHHVGGARLLRQPLPVQIEHGARSYLHHRLVDLGCVYRGKVGWQREYQRAALQPCVICTTEFRPRRGTRCCSQKCAGRWWRARQRGEME